MNEYEAKIILRENQVEIDPTDDRNVVDIVNDPKLGLIASARTVEISAVAVEE